MARAERQKIAHGLGVSKHQIDGPGGDAFGLLLILPKLTNDEGCSCLPRKRPSRMLSTRVRIQAIAKEAIGTLRIGDVLFRELERLVASLERHLRLLSSHEAKKFAAPKEDEALRLEPDETFEGK